MRFIAVPLMLVLLAGCDTAGGDGPRGPDTSSANAPKALDTATPVEGRYMRLAKKAEADGKPELAAVLYRAALQANEKDAAPRIASAELLEKAGEYQSAAMLYADLAKEAGDDVGMTLLAARNALKAGDYTQARTLYEAVIVKNPADWRAYNGLAVTHDMEGNPAAAQNNYPIAYEKAPAESRTAIMANWALSLMLAEKPGDAVEKLASLPDAESNPILKTRLALAYALAGRPEDALRLGLAKAPTADDLRRELRGVSPPVSKPTGKKTETEKAFDKAATPMGAVPPSRPVPPPPAALPKAAPPKALDVQGVPSTAIVAPDQ